MGDRRLLGETSSMGRGIVEKSGKRKRGGQPGNQNAKKHGAYSQDGRGRIEEADALIEECQSLIKAIDKEDFHVFERLVLNKNRRCWAVLTEIVTSLVNVRLQ